MVGNSIAPNSTLCSVFGTLHQYSINASSCWSFMIALHCYVIVIHNPKLASSLWRYYIIYGFGMPALLTIALYISQAILNRGTVTGDADYQCWIASQYPELRVILYFPLLWLHFLGILFFYLRILVMIQTRTRELASSQDKTNIDEGLLAVKSDGADTSRSTIPASQSFSGPATNPNPVTHQIISGDFSPEASIAHQLPRYSSPIKHKHNPNVNEPAVPSRLTVTESAPAAKMISSRNKLITKTFIVSVGCLISWIPATAVRVLLIIPGSKVPFWLSYLMALGFSLSGLFNSTAFLVGILWEKWPKTRPKANGGVDSLS
ncbi:hypothetical protein BCR33DRAFT_149984 [Rhizoclosmatium globosum]|uniref:G-protein coupled receptors family 2 profile 2 domain-containing protein n=1 Tax=Rhizoclosmatium globosum TaxID=329046 RepID=A0A1Y2AKI5_9FUNG|nr:hypothetical protein BCR33DRAFT_149984 [Rhizoclosmatium globosum]|eukprot:ORY22747.1 hypothetical protein BCR33DRAFT_149984 [Rhizoclosmatium globosum]